MDGCDIESEIRQDDNTGAGLRPHEAGILAHLHVRKGIALPELAGIEERSSGQPLPMSFGVGVEPALAGGWLVEKHGAQTAHVRVFAPQSIDLIRDAMRRGPVIIVPVHDKAAATPPDAFIAFEAEALLLCVAGIADARVVRDEVDDGVGAVVENDELALGIVLREEGADGARHKGTPIRGGHDAGNERVLFKRKRHCKLRMAR